MAVLLLETGDALLHENSDRMRLELALVIAIFHHYRSKVMGHS